MDSSANIDTFVAFFKSVPVHMRQLVDVNSGRRQKAAVTLAETGTLTLEHLKFLHTEALVVLNMDLALAFFEPGNYDQFEYVMKEMKQGRNSLAQVAEKGGQLNRVLAHASDKVRNARHYFYFDSMDNTLTSACKFRDAAKQKVIAFGKYISAFTLHRLTNRNFVEAETLMQQSMQKARAKCVSVHEQRAYARIVSGFLHDICVAKNVGEDMPNTIAAAIVPYINGHGIAKSSSEAMVRFAFASEVLQRLLSDTTVEVLVMRFVQTGAFDWLAALCACTRIPKSVVVRTLTYLQLYLQMDTDNVPKQQSYLHMTALLLFMVPVCSWPYLEDAIKKTIGKKQPYHCAAFVKQMQFPQAYCNALYSTRNVQPPTLRVYFSKDDRERALALLWSVCLYVGLYTDSITDRRTQMQSRMWPVSEAHAAEYAGKLSPRIDTYLPVELVHLIAVYAAVIEHPNQNQEASALPLQYIGNLPY